MSDETATPATVPSVTDVAGDRLPEADTAGDTDTQNTPEMPPQSAVEPSEPAAQADTAEQPDTGNKRDAKLAAEASKWRVTARQAEAKLAVEQARISEMNRREAQRLAAVQLQDPADMWIDGTTPDQLIGEDGLIDPDLVADHAARTVAAHPHWARTKPVVGAPATAVTGDGKYEPAPPALDWPAFMRRGNSAG